MKAALVLAAFLAVAVAAHINLQYPEEWQLWKSQHGKSYNSQREELERHLVWLSNREYINAHNKNADIFGFTLAMNHFGDIVSWKSSPTSSVLYHSSLVLLTIVAATVIKE